eukprot:1112256_1
MGSWCFILSVCVVRSSRFLLSNDWSALEWVDLDVQLPRPSVYMAAASYNNSIFIFGGYGETSPLYNQTVKFDLLSQKITDLGEIYYHLTFTARANITHKSITYFTPLIMRLIHHTSLFII